VVKILTLSQDAKTLYVGGTFTAVNDLKRDNFAAFNVANGALLPLAPIVNRAVNAIASIGQTVYIGGSFNTVNGLARNNLAAFTASGAMTSWAPKPDAAVQALVATPDKRRIVAGGNFSKLGTTAALGMGSVDAGSGTVQPWKANTVVKDYGDGASILSMNVDADTVYATGYTYGTVNGIAGNFEGVMAADPTTGNVKWLQDCHGDTYDVAPVGDVVYSVGHSHYCQNIGGFPDTNPRSAFYRALAVTKAATGTVNPNGQPGSAYGNFAGQPAPSLYNWFPQVSIGEETDLSQGAWSVRGNSKYVVLGGEFTRVNGKLQQGLVRMAIPTLAPNLRGPQVTGADIAPTATPQADGKVLVSWKANSDQDDQLLGYDVIRSGRVVKTMTATSQFWNRPTVSTTDASGKAGVTYAYSVRVRDPHGNTVTSPSVSVTYPSNPAYAKLMVTDGATHQWRLGSAAGQTTDPDRGSSPAAMTVQPGVAFGTAGALPADTDTAASLDGSAQAKAQSASTASSATVSVEAWFKTSGGTGGALVGFGAANRSGATVAGDRQVYLTSGGQLAFAVRPTASTKAVTATGSSAYNDGKWHQLVAVQSSATVELYVDGTRVASVASTAKLPTAAGTWVLGGATPSDLAGASGSTFNGSLDDVSVFGTALSSRQVRNHYLTGQPGYGVIIVRPSER